MLKVVIGHSADVDGPDAIAAVIAQCQDQLAGQLPQAGILLAAIDFDHAALLTNIQAAFPGITLIGGTTDGEVSSVLGFQEDSMLLTLFCTDRITIRAGLGRGMSIDAAAAAMEAIASLGGADHHQAKLCITLPDGVEAGTEAALRQLQQILPVGTPIVGGRVGDQFRFAQTYQFYQGEVLQNTLPILVFYGDLRVSHGIASGWQPVTRQAVVTKSAGPIVYEIDHQPAKAFYNDYLGAELPITGEYPLAVFEGASERFYLRASNYGDDANGSVRFMGDIPEQAKVQITHATCDQIIHATHDAVADALNHYPGQQPALALIFSCAARRWLLGNRAKEEYEIAKMLLDPAIPIAGFFTYGEIGPLEMGGNSCYHQETLLIVLLGVA